MRAIHLCFWLHHPYELKESGQWDKGYFGGEAEFRKANQEEFQPLLALLERNVQRYKRFHFSLVVTGMWLDQAERWDAELIKRVQKLVKTGNVQLIVTPYYDTMAAFYELDELKNQVIQMQQKLEQVFGVKSEILALPELTYNNHIAKWAEKNGFKMMLAGEAVKVLDWRSVNKVYEAKACEKLRVLFLNSDLTNLVAKADDIIMLKEVSEINVATLDDDVPSGADVFVRGLSDKVDTKKVYRRSFSARLFLKRLDLAFLWGDSVNLYFDAEIFARWRELGIIGFFDELIKTWLDMVGTSLVNAHDLLEVEVTSAISVKKTASWRGEADKEYQLPEWWTATENKNSLDLYSLRANIVKTRDRDLYVDFAKLSGYTHARGGKAFADILADLQKRVLNGMDGVAADADVRGGMTASTSVNIKFDHKARESRRRREALIQMYREANGSLDGENWDEESDDAEAAIQVLAQRMQQVQDMEPIYDDLIEAEVVAEDIWMDEVSMSAEAENGEEMSEHGGSDAEVNCEKVKEEEDKVKNKSQTKAKPQAKARKTRMKITID